MSKRKQKKRLSPPKWSLRGRLVSWYETKGPVFRFCLKLGAMMALFYALMATPYFDQMLYSYLEANAWFSNVILNVLGQHTTLAGVTIQSPKFAVEIQRGCDAVEPTWLFCAAILSFPSTWPHKLLGMLAGAVLLQILNIVRIVTLFWIGAYLPAIFNTSHMELWPVVFVLVAVTLFVGWKDWTSHRQTPHAVA